MKGVFQFNFHPTFWVSVYLQNKNFEWKKIKKSSQIWKHCWSLQLFLPHSPFFDLLVSSDLGKLCDTFSYTKQLIINSMVTPLTFLGLLNVSSHSIIKELKFRILNWGEVKMAQEVLLLQNETSISISEFMIYYITFFLIKKTI